MEMMVDPVITTAGLTYERAYIELVRQCRDDETKYAATLSAAHNQVSTQLIAMKGKLVPCETLKRNSNIAGAAEIKGLS